MKDWDSYFIRMAEFVSQKSKDPSTKCGAVIVGPHNEVRSTGYNGFPRGVLDLEYRYANRPKKYFFAEHAERNAIYNAARHGIATDGCTIFVTGYPCHDCSRAIIQSGIKEVVYLKSKETGFSERWKESNEFASTMFNESGVLIREFGYKGEKNVENE